VFDLVLSTSQTTNSTKGSDERDLLFARLFGLHAILQSELLSRSSPDDFRRAVSECCLLAEKKSYLREPAGWVLLKSLKALAETSGVEWREEGLRAAAEIICSSGGRKGWTLEQVALIVGLQALGTVSRNIKRETFFFGLLNVCPRFRISLGSRS
jgi:DNA polymerase phi